MFALVVRFELRDAESAAAFDRLVTETVAEIKEHEPGTLVYARHRVQSAPLSRVFYEVYADEAAFNEHEHMPHTRRFLIERERFVASFRVEFLSSTEALGLPKAD